MKTLQQLIKAGNYNYQHISNNMEKSMPPIKKLRLNLKLITLSNYKTTQEIYDTYGSKLAHPLELFDYGAKHPNEQRKNPIFTIWRDESQFWYAMLYGRGSHRTARIDRSDPVVEFHGDCRVLVCEDSRDLTLEPLAPFDLGSLELSYAGVKYKIIKV